jgi:hypothetical protein
MIFFRDEASQVQAPYRTCPFPCHCCGNALARQKDKWVHHAAAYPTYSPDSSSSIYFAPPESIPSYRHGLIIRTINLCTDPQAVVADFQRILAYFSNSPTAVPIKATLTSGDNFNFAGPIPVALLKGLACRPHEEPTEDESIGSGTMTGAEGEASNFATKEMDEEENDAGALADAENMEEDDVAGGM